MYQVGHRKKNRRRRRVVWLIIGLLLLVVIVVAVVFVLHHLKSKTTIKQATPVTTKVTYNTKLKHYDEPDFGLDLPATWQVAASPVGLYHLFRWQDNTGQVLQIYEDTIPANFAVNRVLIVENQVDRVQIDGNVSDNCSQFTKNTQAAPNQVGVPAKWQGINFVCDQFNRERNVVGTSSTEGTNTVSLRQPASGSQHPFFFTYTSTAINPDYTVFYNALQSLQLH